MSMEFWLQIATIASPIIGAVAIIVSLWISHQSSKEAKEQILKMSQLLETFVAAENIHLVGIKQENAKALAELEPKIQELQLQLSTVSPFRAVCSIEEKDEQRARQTLLDELQMLNKKKEDFLKEQSLIHDYIIRISKNKFEK